MQILGLELLAMTLVPLEPVVMARVPIVNPGRGAILYSYIRMAPMVR